MDSFSLDENENRFNKDLSHAVSSTPVKRKLICPVCKKQYQVKFYFDKHVASHSDQGVDKANVSIAVHLNASDLSMNQLLEGSTADTTLNVAGTQSQFRVPAQPPTKRKARSSLPSAKKAHLICTYCLKRYVCSKSFKAHLRAHTIQEAASKFPNAEEILDNCSDLATEALTSSANSPSVGESGQAFRELVGYVTNVSSVDWMKFSHEVCSELVKTIINKKCLLPSSLVSGFIDQVENILSNNELCNMLCDYLKLSDNFYGDVLSQFLLEFILNYITEIMKFISKTFRSNAARCPNQSQNVEIDKEDRQVIYYIAGSIIRGYLKIAKRSKKSSSWQSIASVIHTNILIDKPTGDLEKDSEWTECVDRGGLLYVSEKCQIFFVNLAKVVFSCEKKNGSIDYDTVISKVSNSHLSIEWDDIIGDSLSESVSLGLMNDVAQCFSKTCGRGFAKRRLNFLRSKPMVSMPTRHLVATRKKR